MVLLRFAAASHGSPLRLGHAMASRSRDARDPREASRPEENLRCAAARCAAGHGDVATESMVNLWSNNK